MFIFPRPQFVSWSSDLSVCVSCWIASRGKTNYINLGSFLIKPVQRVMRYPLLLMELLGATPEYHHDRPELTEALLAVKEINVNINEYKRRKDLGKKKKFLQASIASSARCPLAPCDLLSPCCPQW